MKILVTYAVQGEFTELKFPGLIGEEEVQVGYLRTGIGKVKSAFLPYGSDKSCAARFGCQCGYGRNCPPSGGGYFCMPPFCRP